MILGVGTDIIEVERIRVAVERFGDRFLRRVLRDEEISYCQRHREPSPFIAARFAAKEAISKAFGTGITGQLGWLDMEIGHESGGRPVVLLHGKGSDLFAIRGAVRLHISLSHTQHYATAVAVLEG